MDVNVNNTTRYTMWYMYVTVVTKLRTLSLNS